MITFAGNVLACNAKDFYVFMFQAYPEDPAEFKPLTEDE